MDKDIELSETMLDEQESFCEHYSVNLESGLIVKND